MAKFRKSKTLSTHNLRYAAINFQLPVLLMLGLALLSCLPTNAIAKPERRFPRVVRNLRPHSDFMRDMMMKDTRKNYATQSKVSNNSLSGAVVLPVNSDISSGEYLLHFKIGTPPRDFAAIADTGSDLVWVACDPCPLDQCGPQMVFETNASSTYESPTCSSATCNKFVSSRPDQFSCSTTNRCAYNLTYGTGQTSGELSSDVLTLSSANGGSESFPGFNFGCSHELSEGLELPIAALGQYQGMSLIEQIGSTVGNVFSFCFASHFDNKTTEFVIGRTVTENLTYTPLLPLSEHYYVNVTGISVDGVLLNIPVDAFTLDSKSNGGVILDTGSTISTLLEPAFNPLRQALDSKITYPKVDDPTGLGFDLCYDVTAIQFNSFNQLGFPSITFHFENLNMLLPVESTFLFEASPNATLSACLAMFSGGTFGINVIGNYQMQNQFYQFDLENGEVGIKPEQC